MTKIAPGNALLALFRRDRFILHCVGSGVYMMWCFARACMEARQDGSLIYPSMMLRTGDGWASCGICNLEVSPLDYLQRTDGLSMRDAVKRLNGSRSAFYSYLKKSRLERAGLIAYLE